MNPIMNQLAKQAFNSSGFGQIKQMMNLVRNANNPQAVFNQLVSSNPQLNQVMNLINQNGGNPKNAFYAMARQKGIDPNEILKLLK